MSNIFRKSYTTPLPVGAELVAVKGVPSARFKRKGKAITAPLTKDGTRVRVFSPFYYGTVDGKPVRLFTDAVASQQRLAELLRKAERKESGVADPFEEHRRRPLVDHVDEWEAAMRNDIIRKGQTVQSAGGAVSRGVRGEKHIRYSVGCVRRIIEASKFSIMADISASRVQGYLADLRKDRPGRRPDPSKETYTRAELAEMVGVKAQQITALIKHHRLKGEGNGKRRRYPKETAESLYELRAKGASIKTCNLYLAAMKAFCQWLVRERRLLESPLEYLDGGDVKLDRRHDRRILDEAELRKVMESATHSKVVFRGMTGCDREILYETACASGFRASELAALCPKDFDLKLSEVRLSAEDVRHNAASFLTRRPATARRFLSS